MLATAATSLPQICAECCRQLCCACPSLAAMLGFCCLLPFPCCRPPNKLGAAAVRYKLQPWRRSAAILCFCCRLRFPLLQAPTHALSCCAVMYRAALLAPIHVSAAGCLSPLLQAPTDALSCCAVTYSAALLVHVMFLLPAAFPLAAGPSICLELLRCAVQSSPQAIPHLAALPSIQAIPQEAFDGLLCAHTRLTPKMVGHDMGNLLKLPHAQRITSSQLCRLLAHCMDPFLVRSGAPAALLRSVQSSFQ